MGIYCLAIVGKGRIDAKLQKWGHQGWNWVLKSSRTLSVCAMIGLSSSWPMASFSSPCFVSLPSWPSFPVPFGFLLFSCRHGFLHVAGEDVPRMLQAPSHTLAPVACWEVVLLFPNIPMCIFREGLWPCLAHIPPPWTVPMSGQGAVNNWLIAPSEPGGGTMN